MLDGQSFLFAFLAAVPVAVAVAWFRWAMNGRHLLTPVFVMLGNLFVIIVAAQKVGQDVAVYLFLLFAFASVPVCIEYYVSAWFQARIRSRKQRENRF